jgi:hypothetical protein
MTETTTQCFAGPTTRQHAGLTIGSYNVDRKLVAAVQNSACGARCHEAANLLNSYGLAAQAYARSASRGDGEASGRELEVLERSECALRVFLSQCRGQRRFVYSS